MSEPPVLQGEEELILQEGVTLAIDLPLTYPEASVMKLEDTVAVKSNSAELLTAAPRKLIEVV